jgi:hypothetical protein
MLRFIVSALMAAAPLAVLAADVPEFTTTIQDHRFAPAETTIPANTKVKLIVVNKDATAEEFESQDLGREKIVTGNASISVFVGPLKAGRYRFFGDFHQDTAQGVLVVH